MPFILSVKSRSPFSLTTSLTRNLILLYSNKYGRAPLSVDNSRPTTLWFCLPPISKREMLDRASCEIFSSSGWPLMKKAKFLILKHVQIRNGKHVKRTRWFVWKKRVYWPFGALFDSVVLIWRVGKSWYLFRAFIRSQLRDLDSEVDNSREDFILVLVLLTSQQEVHF